MRPNIQLCVPNALKRWRQAEKNACCVGPKLDYELVSPLWQNVYYYFFNTRGSIEPEG